MKLLVLLVLLLPLAACGPNPNLRIEDPSNLAVERVTAVQSMQVLAAAPAGAANLGLVEGTSCQNKMWDAKASEDVALDQTKIKAVELGATALVGVVYAPAGTSLWKNCWTSVTATATAIRQ